MEGERGREWREGEGGRVRDGGEEGNGGRKGMEGERGREGERLGGGGERDCILVCKMCQAYMYFMMPSGIGALRACACRLSFLHWS